jgi:hypothetical protein
LVIETASGRLFYYDTNVLAYIDAGEVPDFLSAVSNAHGKHVVSDTVLEELEKSFEADIFQRHSFLYVLSHEALYLDGSVNFYNSAVPSTNAGKADALELFLGGLLRSAAGSNSVPDLNSLFRDGMNDVLNAMMEDLPEGTAPRLISQLDQARVQLIKGIADLSEISGPIVSKDELEAHSMGPKYLGNIRPPSVVMKIAKMYPDAAEWLGKLTVPLKASEDVKTRIQELCAALVIAGFARDKSIAKDDPVKSESGARAQFRDISHICSASVCNVFVTADKRCAKLAFAVFEALGMRKEVLHLIPAGKEEVKLRLVGEDYWP